MEETFSWLRGPSDYQLAADATKHVGEIPEHRSVRGWSPFAEEGIHSISTTNFRPGNGVSPMAERSLIAVVVSTGNRCPACLLINTSHLAEILEDSARARRMTVNYRSVALSLRQRAIADAAAKFTLASHQTDLSILIVRETSASAMRKFSLFAGSRQSSTLRTEFRWLSASGPIGSFSASLSQRGTFWLLAQWVRFFQPCVCIGQSLSFVA